MKWTSQRALANSKIVKASYIWLLLVPLLARTLNTLNETVNFTIFGAQISLSTSLPFSWQLLFLAACSFSIANILFSIFCPELIKSYENFSEFESHGKTRMQINTALKSIVWNVKGNSVKSEYIKTLSSYFLFYKDGKSRDESRLNSDSISLFNNVDQQIGKNSNAFYFTYAVLDKHNQTAIFFSFLSYLSGLIFVAIIAIQNFYYVIKTMI